MAFGIRLTKKSQIVVFVIIAIVVIVGGKVLYSAGYLPGFKPAVSSVPKSANVPKGIELARTEVPQVPLPTTTESRLDKPPIRMLVWAWNSQMGELYAVGGPNTTRGSIAEKHGVNITFTRQDDAEKMKQELVTFAQELKAGNPNPSTGAYFVQIMGDGYAQFAAAVNPMLKKVGPEYHVLLVGSAGASHGEDKFEGSPAWKKDPSKAKGGVVSGYLRDGDWNIAQKWAGDFKINNNPDEKTWDPDALNWIAADDYIDAVNKLITGYREDRPVIKNGKKTGETVTIDCGRNGVFDKNGNKVHDDPCGVVTWTPGDVMVAQQVGGLVSILSTRENDGQMPNAIIGIAKWCSDNRETVDEMLAAFFEGADQVRLYPDAMKRAGEISAKVYGEQNGDYWTRYYKGVTERDKSGAMIDLGGSTVYNLADNLNLFGLAGGRLNRFEATYTVFGDIVSQQYPNLVPSYPSFREVSDTSFLQDVSRKYQVTAPAEEQTTYSAGEQITQKGGNRDFAAITFKSGSDELTPEGLRACEDLAKQLAVNNFSVEIHGHTDNAGNPQQNMELSRRRAERVKQYLESKYPGTFPANRIKPVIPHGQSDPVADNSTDAGRAKNRRVQVVMGTA